ncbi:MAG: hypothetical protein LBI67_06845 [Treponema sp.]|jgi:hypothetical protein|nr:hypothetical protein [Treponema sp.]
MTFIDVLVALAITTLFLFGFSQAFLPVYYAWGRSLEDYKTANTIHFVSESFRNECAKPERNIKNWENSVQTAKELEDYTIEELWQGGILRAMRLTCIISGERIEVIGLCTP